MEDRVHEVSRDGCRAIIMPRMNRATSYPRFRRRLELRSLRSGGLAGPADKAHAGHNNKQGWERNMSALSRRDFLLSSGAAAVAAFSGSARAAMGPADKFDLVIRA